MEIIELGPLSQGEIEGRRECFVDALFDDAFDEQLRESAPEGIPRDELLSRLVRGGFPETVERDPERRADWFDAYVTALIERDVRDLAAIERGGDLVALLRLLAARSGRLLNVADLARDIRLSEPTTRRYLRWLEAVFLFTRVPAWSTNLSKRVTRAPKVALTDSGLAASLVRTDESRLRDDPTLVGGLLEAFVLMEIRKQASWSRTRPGIYHFRERQLNEVDIVLEARRGDVVGIEVKFASVVDERDLRGLRALASRAGTRFRRGVVLHAGEETVALGPDLWAAPISSLWRIEAS